MYGKALTLLAAAAVASLTACSSGGSTHTTAPVGPHSSSAAAPGTTSLAAPSSSSPPPSGGVVNTAGWCGELVNGGKGVVDVGNVPVGDPATLRAKIAKLISDAPAEIRPGLIVLQKIMNKELDGDQNADEEYMVGANIAPVQHTIQWIETHCGAAALGQLS